MNRGWNAGGSCYTLRNVPDEIPALEAIGILTEDFPSSTDETNESQQCLHQGALSGTVRTKEHDELTASQGEVDIAQGLGCTETDRGISNLEDLRCFTHIRAQSPASAGSDASRLDSHPRSGASQVATRHRCAHRFPWRASRPG